MHKLRVKLQRTVDNTYDIVIGLTLPYIVKDIAHRWPEAKKFIVTDSTVQRLYGNSLAAFFRRSGQTVPVLNIPSGEKNKTRAIKERIENRLLGLGVERSSLVIALGGGVVGDLAGFVAATMLRGIPYIHIPTTLLSQVDSSVGGKVAVDHPLGKNLLGAFYQPKKVYIDIATLRTLPDREFRCGMAEVIKYGVTMDHSLFLYLEQNAEKVLTRNSAALTYIIRQCCLLKKNIVEKDERESGLRRILNFGHTIGHALEASSGYSLKHGEAVSIGMAVEAKLSSAMAMIDETTVQRFIRLLRLYRLPVSLPKGIRRSKILLNTAYDKKTLHGTPQYTLLTGIGSARHSVTLPSTKIFRGLSV